MKQINKITDFFEKEGYKSTGIILTSFSSFDYKVILSILRKLNLSKEDYNNIFLFECNPQKRDIKTKDIASSILNKRIFVPFCGNSGCEKCIGNGKTRPEKYFHPKVWMIRFVNIECVEEVEWRVVVSSHNLSNNTLVDGYISFDAKVGSNTSNINDPLVDFLQMIGSDCISKTFLDEIMRLDYGIKRPTYYFSEGICDKKITNRSKKINDELKGSKKIWIVSPFVNNKFLKDIDAYNKESVEIYAPMNEAAYLFGEVDNNISIFSNSPTPLDPVSEFWHSKQYIIQNNEGKYLYIVGSHNATHNAFTNNIEFSVSISIGEDEKNSILKSWKEFFGSEVKGSISRVASTSDKFALPSYMTNGENTIDEAELNDIFENEKKNVRENAIKSIYKEVFGCSDDSADFCLGLYCKDIKNDAISQIVESLQKDNPALEDDGVWKDYVNQCMRLYDICTNKG